MVKPPYTRLLEILQDRFPSYETEQFNAALVEMRQAVGGTFKGFTVENLADELEPFLLTAKPPKQKVPMVASPPVPKPPPGFEGQMSGTACCICMEIMMNNEKLTDFPCEHKFHTECIRQWLERNAVCPLCKKFTLMSDEYPALL